MIKKIMILICIFIFLIIGISGTGFDPDIVEELTDAGAEFGSDILQFGEGEYNIGNLIEGFEETDIIVSSVKVTKHEEISTINFFGDDPSARIKGDVYENIDTNELAYIKLGENGDIISADLTAGEETVFFLGGKENKVLAGQRIILKDGKITLKGGDSYEYKEKGFEEFTKVDFLGESLEVEKDLEGNSIFAGDLTISGNEVRGFGEGNIGKVTVSEEEIVEVWGNTDATINGIKCSVSRDNVKISYDENFDLSNCQGNCLNLGESMDIKGSGFTVSLQKGNDIFPEFGEEQDYPTSSRLDFIPNSGSLKIERISEKGQPLALSVNMVGEADIINGPWQLKADGENLYARVTEEIICSLPFRSFDGTLQNREIQDCVFDRQIPSDMRIKYSDSETSHKIYDLDVETKYYKKPSEQEIKKIEEEISKLNLLKEPIERERNSIFENPFVKELLEERNKLINEELYTIEDAEGNVRIGRINNKVQERIDEINKNQDILKINDLDIYLRSFENNLYYLNHELRGKLTTGGFSEVLLANDGNIQVSYPEFTQGFPVIPNAKIRYYTGQELGDTLNKLDLEVGSKLQTCSDTQTKLRLLWELDRLKNREQDSIKFKLANEEEIQYNLDGTYTFWDGNNVMTKENKNLDKGFNKWLNNVFAYSNTGSLTRHLTPIENINDLQAGDIITLHPDPNTGYGHTMGIKEILEIPPGSGNKYYRLFAGSDPAIDARIYPNLWDKQDFIEQIKSGGVHLLRWG